MLNHRGISSPYSQKSADFARGGFSYVGAESGKLPHRGIALPYNKTSADIARGGFSARMETLGLEPKTSRM